MKEYLKQKFPNQYQKFSDWHARYENYLPVVFFCLGFLFDILTLGDVDDLSNIIVLTLNLFICVAVLFVEYAEIVSTQIKNKFLKRLFIYRIDIFHFFLGAQLSVYTLFYFKSGSVANSFYFLLVMMLLLMLNGVKVFQRFGLIVRTSLVKLCLISYLIYIIPILLGLSHSFIFYFCILFASSISFFFFYYLNKRNNKKDENLKRFLVPQLSVAALFLLLFIFKVLPPLPLSLKYIGIFHDVSRENGHYNTSSLSPWWSFWNSSEDEFMARPGDKVYVFTRIFSPGGFSGTVYIRWFYKNKHTWFESDRIPLTITGGRKEGFRGFAYKENYSPGQWQVRVETENELEIGRINFTILEDVKDSERKFKLIKR